MWNYKSREREECLSVYYSKFTFKSPGFFFFIDCGYKFFIHGVVGSIEYKSQPLGNKTR